MNRILSSRLAGIRSLGHRGFATSLPGSQRLHSNEPEKVINPDEPIKFFGSDAAKWTAQQTRSGRQNEETLWYQPYVIMGSVLVFMIYFCVLREESDVDGELNKSLYDRIDGMEEIQLRIVHKYNAENKVDNGTIEARMKELNISLPKY